MPTSQTSAICPGHGHALSLSLSSCSFSYTGLKFGSPSRAKRAPTLLNSGEASPKSRPVLRCACSCGARSHGVRERMYGRPGFVVLVWRCGVVVWAVCGGVGAGQFRGNAEFSKQSRKHGGRSRKTRTWSRKHEGHCRTTARQKSKSMTAAVEKQKAASRKQEKIYAARLRCPS